MQITRRAALIFRLGAGVVVCGLAIGHAHLASAALLPPQAGLALWLEAESGVTTDSFGRVGAWADQTSNGYNVGQSTNGAKPILVADQMNNHLPVLRFDGVDDLLNNTATSILASGQARTVLIVAKATGNSGSFGLGGALLFFRRTGPVFGLSQLDLGNSSEYIHTDGLFYNHTTSLQNSVVSNSFLATYESTGSSISEWLNHNSVAVSNDPVLAESGATGFTIGNREDQPMTYAPWHGDIAAILVYDSVLSSTDRIAAENYLFDKWIPEPASASMLCIVAGSVAISRKRREIRKNHPFSID